MMSNKKGNERQSPFSKKSSFKIFLIRVMVWGLVGGTSIVGIVMSIEGIRQLFFTRNPSFTLRHIQLIIRKGNLSESNIKRLLGIKEGEVNLFELDLGQLRDRLRQNPLIEDAIIYRKLPDTLQITISGRTPVAQLLIPGGLSIDGDGYVLPPVPLVKRKVLPVIVGTAELARAQEGSQLLSPFILKVVKFLEQISTLDESDILIIDTITLNPRDGLIHVRLRGNARYFVAGGARLDLPVDSLWEAYLKGIEVVKYRALGCQWTASIDARYNRVYVRSTP